MKKFNPIQLLLGFILTMVFCSCTPKYGAHFSPSDNFYEREPPKVITAQQAVGEVQEMKSDRLTVAPLAESDQLVVSKRKMLTVKPNPFIEKLVQKHQQQVENIENADLKAEAVEKAFKKEEKRVKKEIIKEVKKEIKSIKATNQDDDYVLMMILAVLIPPLAVGLTYGITDKFWISLLLTLLFYVPGMVYALIVVNNYYR